MFKFCLLIVALLCATHCAVAFLPSARVLGLTVHHAPSTALMACRRNNKEEKRKRNREYARRFSKNGESRKKVVVETKRAIVAANEEKFQAEVFKLTTDEDMPAYTGFDFN